MLQTLEAAGLEINKKVGFTTHPISGPFGVHHRFQNRNFECASTQIKIHQEGVGKNCDQSDHPGNVGSLLMAMPFLRAFTDTLVAFFSQHHSSGWYTKHPIWPQIRVQLAEINLLLKKWSGRKFQGQAPVRVLHGGGVWTSPQDRSCTIFGGRMGGFTST